MATEQGHHYGYTEARKNPFGEKYDRKSGKEPRPKLRAVVSLSYEASQLNKISHVFEPNKFVISQRWTVGSDD